MNSFLDYQKNLLSLMDSAQVEYFPPPRRVPLCIFASLYRMAAGNCLPCKSTLYREQHSKLLLITSYIRNESPWECCLQKNRKLKDSPSSSSNSSCSSSSRSESPEPPKKHKQKSHHILLREIRRLRNENSSLRTSVSMLKNDLRDINLSRKDTDAFHKKFYDEYTDKNAQLEIDIEDRNDEIKSLKEEIHKLKQCHLCHSNNNNNNTSHQRVSSGPFACYEFDDQEDDLFCQPVAQESALPEIDIKMDELKLDSDEDQRAMNDYLHRRFNLVDISQQQQGDDDDDDDDDEDVKENFSLFQPTATSYIHQAIMSKLSSARVRLELDDLILKHEPSTQDIIHVLSFSFVDWLSCLLTKFVNKTGPEPVMTATKVFTSHIQNGITGFWDSLLQHYTLEEENQLELLKQIEHDVEIAPSGTAIGDHFDRLILMLYKYHVIDDDAILSWWQNPLDNEKSKKLRKVTTRFVEWVQDNEDEDDDDDEDDNSDDDVDSDKDSNYDDDDDDDGDDDDDDGLFIFAESPVSEDQVELNNESSDVELEINQTNPIDDLLTCENRELCVCHLDKDTTPIPKKNEPCSCSTYTPVIEKKKKSVRIAM